MCKTIKQRVKFKADPATVYDLLADSRKHTAFTGRPGEAPTVLAPAASYLRDERGGSDFVQHSQPTLEPAFALTFYR